MEACHFEDETFERLDLRSMKAFGSTWKNCSFVDCKMDMADWRASKFEGCRFQGCSLRLVNFSTSYFEECDFWNCDFEQASLMGSHLRDSGFKGCRMAYGDTLFQDATVKGKVAFEDCNLHGSSLDFRQVEPKGLSFENCNLWGARISFGCAFFSCTLDERAIQQFLALVARVAQDPRIAELAGDQYRVINRAMDGADKGEKMEVTETATPILPYSPAAVVTGG